MNTLVLLSETLKSMDSNEGKEGEEAETAQSQVHSLAEGVGEAVESLRSRVEGVVKDVDQALSVPHFTETQYDNLHSPERIEKVKAYTRKLDQGII
jgi:hypothetical protein